MLSTKNSLESVKKLASFCWRLAIFRTSRVSGDRQLSQVESCFHSMGMFCGSILWASSVRDSHWESPMWKSDQENDSSFKVNYLVQSFIICLAHLLAHSLWMSSCMSRKLQVTSSETQASMRKPRDTSSQTQASIQKPRVTSFESQASIQKLRVTSPVTQASSLKL